MEDHAEAGAQDSPFSLAPLLSLQLSLGCSWGQVQAGAVSAHHRR